MNKLKSPVVPEDSPLRNPPLELSRRQIQLLDGIRYAAEMSDLAYERLFDKLQEIAASQSEPSTRDIAATMLDAWSVIDAVHRFVELVGILPGLSKGIWLKLLRQRTSDALELRDDVQHQRESVETGIFKGPIWGYLSWAEVDNNRNHTGKWLMISPGAYYAGDKFIYIGPNKLKLRVPPGRIRLNAFKRRVYLGKCVRDVMEATMHISDELAKGKIRAEKPPAPDRRGADMVMEGNLQVLVSASQESGKT